MAFFCQAFTRIAVCTFGIAVFSGSSQTVSISGVVTDSLKQPLQGVTVSLHNANLSDTTDVFGKFTISGAMVVLSSERGRVSPEGLKVSGGKVFFNVPQASDAVTITMLDTKGRTIGRVYRGIPGAGVFSLVLKFPGSRMIGQYLLKISIGSRSYTVKALNAGNKALYSSSEPYSRVSTNAALPKRLSPLSDTLVCTKDTYFASRQFISSFSGFVDSVILYTADAAGFKIADNIVAGWTQEDSDEVNNMVYIGEDLYDPMDGGAAMYLETGLVKTLVQEMQKDTVKTFKAYIMDFGRNDSALSMYAKKKAVLDSTAAPDFSITDAFINDSVPYGCIVVAAVQHFYFELNFQGFMDKSECLEAASAILRQYVHKLE